jgi:RNA polymerase sigma factor (sigma-70 family)
MPNSRDPSEPDFERLRRGVFIIALQRLGNPESAEEVAHETITRVIAAWREGRVTRQDAPGAFVTGVAEHVIADELRRRDRVHPTDPAALDRHADASAANPLEAVLQREDVARVQAEIQRLDPWEQELVFALYYDEDTCAGVAKRWGVKASMVRQRLVRLKRRLAAALSVLKPDSSRLARPADMNGRQRAPAARSGKRS